MEDVVARLARSATDLGLMVTVAAASHPDAALHAALGFGVDTAIPPGGEAAVLSPLPLKVLFPAIAGIDEGRAEEIMQTLESWGIRTFGQYAGMPEVGIFERFGSEGIALQKLAKGAGRAHLEPILPEPAFIQSSELEHPVSSRGTLMSSLESLVGRLCADLNRCSLAAASVQLNMKLESGAGHTRSIRLAVPTRDSRLLLKIIELEIEAQPPDSAVTRIEISADAARPRFLQKDLFKADAPEPERLDLQVARIAGLVGRENVGSPELLDSHRPRSFRMTRFLFGIPAGRRRRKPANSNTPKERVCQRLFDPPLIANVLLTANRPAHISAPPAGSREGIRGKVVQSGGPWLSSGDWWSSQPWSREEWDVELDGGAVCRIFYDRIDEAWKIEGIYD
jgi:protein ImuB